VIVPPHTNPVAKVAHHKAHPAKPVEAPLAGPLPVTAPAPSGNPRRSTLADRLLSPTQIDLSAKNLAQGGLLTLLLIALLYLPVTIFNKATERNHETISGWLAGPRRKMEAAVERIPFARHPLALLLSSLQIPERELPIIFTFFSHRPVK